MTCTVSAGQSGTGFTASIRSVAAKLLRKRKEKKAAAELLSLSDHLLRDIGIDRYEAEYVVRLPVGYRPERMWPKWR